MRRNGYVRTFGVNLDTAVRFPDPDFLLECVDFAFYMLNVRYISTSGLLDLENIPYASTPTSIILTNFEVDMTIHCRVIAFLSADTSRDLVSDLDSRASPMLKPLTA